MSTSKTWPGGGTTTSPTSFSIPASGELSWASLSDFLNALGDSAQGTGFQKFAIRKCTTTPVTVSATSDCIIATQLAVAGAVTVNLPAGATKQVFIIADTTGDAGTNTVTINRAGSDTINGATSTTLTHNGEAVILAYNLADTDWKIVGRMTALSGTITNSDVSATAAIAYSKLAALTSTNILVGSGSNVATSTAVTGDVTISNTGVTSLASSISGAKTFTTSLTIGTAGSPTGYTPSALSVYQTYSASTTTSATFAFAASGSITVTMNLVRIGSAVTMHITGGTLTGTCGSASPLFSFPTSAIPAQFRPTQETVIQSVPIKNGTRSAVPGVLDIGTDGSFAIYLDGTLSTNFTPTASIGFGSGAYTASWSTL